MFPSMRSNVISMDTCVFLLGRAEKRICAYVSADDVVALALDSFQVYKFFEEVDIPVGVMVSTFPGAIKLEYQPTYITCSANTSLGILCHMVKHTAFQHMKSMRERTDKLVLYECTGFNVGKPQLLENPASGHSAVGVIALRPDRLICRYTDI